MDGVSLRAHLLTEKYKGHSWRFVTPTPKRCMIYLNIIVIESMSSGISWWQWINFWFNLSSSIVAFKSNGWFWCSGAGEINFIYWCFFFPFHNFTWTHSFFNWLEILLFMQQFFFNVYYYPFPRWKSLWQRTAQIPSTQLSSDPAVSIGR